MLRNIKRGISNLIVWFPIIWKDRDYDYAYILDILKFKIQKQAKSILKNSNYDGSKSDVQKMNLLVELINRFQNDYYELEWLDYEQDYSEYFKKYQRQFKILNNPEKPLGKIAHNIALNNHKRCKELIFKLLSENIQKWWY